MASKNPSDDTVVIAFRVSRDMARLIAKLAKDDNRSKANFIVDTLTRVLPKAAAVNGKKP